MRLGLRMGLNSRQGGGGDLPSLDLAFALDKTLTARKGPTPTFTRVQATSTGSTYVGADRLIKYAAANEPRFDYDPVTGLCKGLLIEDTRTNLIFPSETLTTQTRTVAAVAHTLSFYGTGTVVLSGVHSATVVGTGDFPSRTTLTFTPTAGSLTLTVTGTVQFAQLEAGAFPLSYIPTTSGSAIRGADVCSIIGDDFSSFYNQSEGTMFAETQIESAARAANPFIVDAFGASPAEFGIRLFGGAAQIVFRDGTVKDITLPTASSMMGIAAAYSSAGNAGSLNGGSAVSGAAFTLPTMTSLQIGNRFTGGNLTTNGHIARIQYFRKRLSNAKLQTITAP